MSPVEVKVREALYALQDPEYQAFQSKLIPNVDPQTVIGVRTPALRKFAKEFGKTEDVAEFLKALPHSCYEENNLHGFLIETIKDYDTCVAHLEAFLPYVDNWATCDMMAPKVLGKHTDRLTERIREWISSEHTYTIRFGIGLLMRFYLDEKFEPIFPEMVAEVRSEEYYVNMMIAWYFATALARQYDAVLPYLVDRRLSPWVHNKTIQKAVESNRIDRETKSYLRTLRMKRQRQNDEEK